MEAYYIEYSAEIQPPGNGKSSQRSDVQVNAIDWPTVARDAASKGTEIQIPLAGFIGSFTSQPGGTLRLAVVTAARNHETDSNKCRAVFDVIPNCGANSIYPVFEDMSGALADSTRSLDQFLTLELDGDLDGVPDSYW